MANRFESPARWFSNAYDNSGMGILFDQVNLHQTNGPFGKGQAGIPCHRTVSNARSQHNRPELVVKAPIGGIAPGQRTRVQRARRVETAKRPSYDVAQLRLITPVTSCLRLQCRSRGVEW
jgi:hypothetical protein